MLYSEHSALTYSAKVSIKERMLDVRDIECAFSKQVTLVITAHQPTAVVERDLRVVQLVPVATLLARLHIDHVGDNVYRTVQRHAGQVAQDWLLLEQLRIVTGVRS